MPYAPQRPPKAPQGPVVVRVYSRRNGRSPLKVLMVLVGAVVGLAVCLALAALASYYGYYQSTGRIIPGVSAGPVYLGGMTREEALVAIQAGWGAQARIRVTNGVQTQEVSPAELGLSIDAEAAVQRAQAAGHGGLIFSEMTQMLVAAWEGWPVRVESHMDEKVARARLEALLPALSLAPVNATIKLENGAPVAVPSALGYTLDVDATLAALVADPAGIMQEGVLAVTSQPVAPRVSDVGPALAEAQRLLDTPVKIEAYDPVSDERLNWTAPREQVATWLTVLPSDEGPQVGLDPQYMQAYLAELAASLGDGRTLVAQQEPAELAAFARQGKPLTLRVRHPATTYVVQPGDTLLKIGWNLGIPYWMIQKANPGLNPDALSAGATINIPSKDDLLPLPVVPNKRIIISISHQRLRVYENGQEIGVHLISTGIDRSPTQPGIFQVQEHELNAYASVWDLYMPHWLGIYEAWPGFMNGIHGLPMLSSGRRLWADVLGRPASYGCIILDLPTAEWLYNWAEEGVVVEIRA